MPTTGGRSFHFSVSVLTVLCVFVLVGWLGRVEAQLSMNESSITTDLEALQNLKQEFLSSSLCIANWTSSNFCDWCGVTCDSDGRVVDLRLPSQALTGTFPSSIQNLTRLESLDLSDNTLNGILPPFVGNWSLLTNLNLSVNEFISEIPLFSPSSALLSLDLHANVFSGDLSDKVEELTSLQYLDLSRNGLDGEVPSFSSLINLRYVDLHNNLLRGSVRNVFVNSSLLFHLDLSQNQLTGDIPVFTAFNSLEYLDLHGNNLSGSVPINFDQLNRLRYLDLSRNSLSGSIPVSVCGISSTALQVLSLSSNRLTGRVPDSLSRCVNLENLYLGNNTLTGDLPNSFDALSSLRTLDLSFNRLTGSIPSLPNGLLTLALENNSFNGSLSKQAGQLPDALQLLSLSRNNFETEIDPGVGILLGLTKLKLDNNRFQGPIPDTWQKLPLDHIDLSKNNFSGRIPVSMGQLENLTIINFAENHLSDAIPPEFVQLQKVSVFNLSHNNLSGPVPRGFIELDRWKNVFIVDNNPGLLWPTSMSPLQAPRDAQQGRHHSWTLKLIFIVDGLLVLVTAYLLYGCLVLSKRKEAVPLLELDLPDPSTEGTVTLDELKRITNNFDETNMVGRGSKSIVYRGLVGGGQVAVKLLTMDSDEKGKKVLVRELNTLGRVRHRNVLRILAVCSHIRTRALVLEYMPFSSLDRFLYHMVGKACLSWETRLSILVGVAQGLKYLHYEHQEPIIHCDLKPSNILLDSDFEAKVADFGIAKFLRADGGEEASMSGLCGSIGYIPPEYAWASSATTRGDVFSFGMVLLELLTARKPYEGWGDEEGKPGSLVEFVSCRYIQKVKSILDPNLVELELGGNLHQEEVKSVLNIGLMCTQVEPKNRPDMQEVVDMLINIRRMRYTSRGPHHHRTIDELAKMPTLWESLAPSSQSTSAEELEKWIARRLP